MKKASRNFVKIISRSVEAEVITSLMTSLCAESSLDAVITECRRGMKASFADADDCEAFVDAVLNCYETLGFSVAEDLGVDVDIYELVVICGDAEQQTYFDQMRMSFGVTQTEALHEVISDISNESDRFERKLGSIDSLCELNGVYKMRSILNCLSSELETKGIFVGDRINQLVSDTVH